MRKEFAAISLLAVLFVHAHLIGKDPHIPYWLNNYSETYSQSPRKAAQEWFRNARFGMFVHMNLASLCENGKSDYLKWIEGEAPDRLLEFLGYSREEYERAVDKNKLLFRKYLLKDFDADRICELAVQSEMKYITFTTLHLGRCYNFETETSDFSSVKAPCGRDLVAELADACRRHGLALFFYLPPEYIQTANAAQTEHNQAVIRELLTKYGPIGGIWFDGIGDYHRDPGNYKNTLDTFAMIRQLQPHALISFKEGAFCEEDFISPEHFLLPFDWEFNEPGRNERFRIRKQRWLQKNAQLWDKCMQYKLREVNTVMQECYNRDAVHVPSGWINDNSARHLSTEEVYDLLEYARYTGSNLLMNIGPRADGSIHPADWEALTGVGALIRNKGWPRLQNEVEFQN